MKLLVVMTIELFFLSTAAPAVAVEWSLWQGNPAGSASWSAPENWLPGLPDPSRAAAVENGGTVVIDAHTPAAALLLGGVGAGSIQQTSGLAEMAGRVSLVNGRYALSGGRLTAASIAIGDPEMTDLQLAADRVSQFVQSGGAVATTGNLEMCVPGWIGNDPVEIIILPFREILYEISSGMLSVGGDLIVGSMGTAPARFTQSGGEISVAGHLRIEGSASTYRLAAGELAVSILEIGPRLDAVNPQLALTGGTLSLAPDTTITVRERLTFGIGGTLLPEPGSTIRFGGHTVENHNKAPFLNDGLSGLRLVMTGENDGQTRMEVGGIDRSASESGLISNYALDTLQVGDYFPASLLLVDEQPNQDTLILDPASNADGGETGEALYVRHLKVTAGSVLNLGGLKLYYGTAEIAPGALISGGTITPIAVPEPSSVIIALMAIVAACGMRGLWNSK